MPATKLGQRTGAPGATGPTAEDPPRRLIPIPNWPERHLWPTEAGLRHLAFHRKTNGFDRCCRMIGGRLLIDEGEFFAWCDAVDAAGGTLPASKEEAAG